MKRFLGTAALAVTLTIASAAVAATPAAAADGWQRAADVSETTYDNGRAKTCRDGFNTFGQWVVRGCFQPYGDYFWLKDPSGNLLPIGIQWWYTAPGGGGARAGVAYWDGGEGAGWTNLNKNFAEGGDLTFRACQVDLPNRTVETTSCSDLVTVDS
jgi:hypothetical protein